LTPAEDDVVFLAYYLKSLNKVLLSFSQGMAIKGFTKDDISSLKLFMPNVQEQQKIASCLSSLDALIAAQAEKVAALKEHKKGLMQGLFPVFQ
jgi:type I restriction enzyme S subunit